jgi:hypothetical protein
MFGPKQPDVDVFALDRGPERGAERGPERAPERVAEEPPRGHREPPRRREAAPPPPPPIRDAEEDEGFVLDYDVEGDSDLGLGEEPTPPDAAEEEPRRGGSEESRRREEGEGREGGRRRRRRGRGRGRGRRDEREPHPSGHQAPPRRADRGEFDEPDDFAGSGADLEFELEESSDLELPQDLQDESPAADEKLPPPRRDQQGERREGRSRRGRHDRGSRGRQPSGERSDYGPPPLDDELPLGDVSRDQPELDEGEPHQDDAASGAPTHKKIPTWEEAVGILIDANMTARANNPDRDRDRGRGGGGGRGRGGRGRGGRR